MRQRQRNQPEHQTAGEQIPPGRPFSTGDGGGTDNLDQLRESADRLLAAADDAIDRTLSGNSDAFLEANRQHGGQ